MTLKQRLNLFGEQYHTRAGKIIDCVPSRQVFASAFVVPMLCALHEDDIVRQAREKDCEAKVCLTHIWFVRHGKLGLRFVKPGVDERCISGTVVIPLDARRCACPASDLPRDLPIELID